MTLCADSCKDVKLLLMLNPGVYRLKREDELGGVLYGTLTRGQYNTLRGDVPNISPPSAWFLIPLGGRRVRFVSV